MTHIFASVAGGMRHTSSLNLPVLYFVRSGTLSYSKRGVSTSACSIPFVNKKDKVIVISGPTGVGKSRLALELAKRLEGEIINADSVQVYCGLDVGSAKPSSSDRKDVPHHLLDKLHPSEEYSAGQFFEDARKSTRDILERDRIPIVTGGTGLYLRWYIYGKPDVPKASMEVTSEVRSELMDLQENGLWDEAVDLVAKAGDPKVPYDSFKEQAEQRLSNTVVDAISDGDNSLGRNPAKILSR